MTALETIDIQTFTCPMQAAVIEARDGLAVTMLPGLPALFGVTHIASGRGVTWQRFAEIAQARAAMEVALSFGAIWTQPAEIIKAALGEPGYRSLWHHMRMAAYPPKRARVHWIDISYHRGRRKRMCLRPKQRRVLRCKAGAL